MTAPAEGRLRGDPGQATGLMLVPLVIGLVSIALLVMVALGDGMRSRTQTRTSADAAALAAADAWRAEVQSRYAELLLAPDVQVGLREFLATDPQVLASGSAVAAEVFAARNSGAVEATDLSADGAALLFRVRTRSSTPARETGRFTYAEAVARVEIRASLCLRDGRFGLRSGTSCLVLGEGLPQTGLLPVPVAGLPALRTEAWLVE